MINNVVYRGTNFEKLKEYLDMSPELIEPHLEGHDNYTEKPHIAIGFALKHFKDAEEAGISTSPCVICIDGKYVDERYQTGNVEVRIAPLSKIEIINPFAEKGIDKLIGFVRNHAHPRLKLFILESCGGNIEDYINTLLRYYKETKRKFDEFRKKKEGKK